MIYIDRNRAVNPINKNDAHEALTKIRVEYEQLHSESKEQFRPKFSYRVWSNNKVKETLQNLFNGKCAFCETPLVGGSDITHFWPKSLYWERAYDWDNLFLSCPTCNRAKGGRAPTSLGKDYGIDGAIILNPCEDNIDKELKCLKNGLFEGLTFKGINTINFFGLNRSDLVKERFRAYDSTASLMQQITKLRNWKDLISEFESLDVKSNEHPHFFNELATEMDDTNSYIFARRTAYKDIIDQASPFTIIEEQTLVEFESKFKAYDWIRKIKISNFKSIEDLTIEFESDNKDQSCMAIIGENGSGKSSILQAIALIFMSKEQREKYVKDVASILRKGTSKGEIKLYFTQTDSYIQLNFSDKSQILDESMDDNQSRPYIPILGYSAIRLPAPNDSTIPTANPISLDNLFNPSLYLPLTESWLANSKYVEESTFTRIAKILKSILHLDNASFFIRQGGQVYLQNNDIKIPLKELSDGYKSIFSIVTNIIYNWSGELNDIDYFRGIVLIDELEVHLHPKWKLKIISSLREAFPNVNFIITTHDPLCLRGFKNNEIVHLERNQEGIVKMEYLNIPTGLNVEQILTGSWFDLESTYDNDTVLLYKQYQQALYKDINSHEVKSLEYDLADKLNIYVENRIERMAQSVAAQIMREENERMEEDGQKISKSELRNKIYLQAKKRLEES
ncbi:AAA family ATPase [Sulfurovum sp.]|uniref:AAA family ATPase n=1 Tax=Sulfurovum sp. TaxID=1969726 RepID=UPI003563B1AD